MTYFVITQYDDEVQPGEHFIVRGKLSHALSPPHAVIMRVACIYKDGQQVPLRYLESNGLSEVTCEWRKKWKYNVYSKLELWFTDEALLGTYRVHIECAWVEHGRLKRQRDIKMRIALGEELKAELDELHEFDEFDELDELGEELEGELKRLEALE